MQCTLDEDEMRHEAGVAQSNRGPDPCDFDDCVVDVCGDVWAATFFLPSPLPVTVHGECTTRVLLALSRDHSGVWSRCMRQLRTGDVGRFQCAGSGAVEWIRAFASCCLLPGTKSAAPLMAQGIASLRGCDAVRFEAAMEALRQHGELGGC